jgi:hypothetical protein
MMKAHKIALTAVLAVAVVASPHGREDGGPRAGAQASTESAVSEGAPSRGVMTLREDLRQLWEDHIVWSRMVIVSVVADLPDAGFALQRLLRNQDDIGDAFAEYYGDEAGEELAALLREHILLGGDILEAAKGGRQKKMEKATKRWYANADEIAEFLAEVNPHWPEQHMSMMMRTHLEMTLDEAGARLSGDWEADIAAYDRVHVGILEMADHLAEGIVAQFPERF